jgi:hypothetical protein
MYAALCEAQKRQPVSPTAFEEPASTCKWAPFRRGRIEGMRRVEFDDDR